MSIAIITGASSGIGREFVRQLKGTPGIDAFWLVARRAEPMQALAQELGIEAQIISADLCREEGVRAVTDKLAAERPEVGLLINAAGFGTFGAYDQLSADEVGRMIDLNVKALVLLTHATLPYMTRGGRIIEMGSASCFTPLPYFNVYASTKAFVLHYTKALNFELRSRGIRATCFCPGWVDTAFLGLSKEHRGVRMPKSMKPLLNVSRVVRGALRASRRGRAMYVTGWYTKLQHLLFKTVPDPILSRLWLGMLTEEESE